MTAYGTLTLSGAPRILLVEDEHEIARISLGYLKEAGYVVRHAATGEDAIRLLKAEPVQLILLDVMLPDTDGIALARKIRNSDSHSNVPIIMLTALNSEEDLIKGLDVGADDYITKPFSANELLARVNAILRRVHAKKPGNRTLTWGKDDRLKLDAATRVATLDGKKISLAPKEFDLLWAIMDADGAVLDRNTLLQDVWGYTYIGDTRTVDVHVRQLRKKLDDACPIDTVWGKGYQLHKED